MTSHYRHHLLCCQMTFRYLLKRSLNFSTNFAHASSSASLPTKIVLPSKREEKAFVEMDTEKLTRFVCINYLKDGKDPEIKPDSEYPEWLWKVNTKPLPPLEELSEEEHGWIYWREVRRHFLREEQRRRHLGNKYAAVQRNVKVL